MRGRELLAVLAVIYAARRRSPLLPLSRRRSHSQASTKRQQTSTKQNKTNTNKQKSVLSKHKHARASPSSTSKHTGRRSLENGGRGLDGAGTFRRRGGTRPKCGGGGGGHEGRPCQPDAGDSLQHGHDRVPTHTHVRLYKHVNECKYLQAQNTQRHKHRHTHRIMQTKYKTQHDRAKLCDAREFCPRLRREEKRLSAGGEGKKGKKVIKKKKNNKNKRTRIKKKNWFSLASTHAGDRQTALPTDACEAARLGPLAAALASLRGLVVARSPPWCARQPRRRRKGLGAAVRALPHEIRLRFICVCVYICAYRHLATLLLSFPCPLPSPLSPYQSATFRPHFPPPPTHLVC